MSYRFMLLALFCLTACENPVKRAVRNTTYSAYEMVGIQKSDLLKRRISDVTEEQKETSESFEDALDKLRKLYKLEGGQLEKQYRSLRSSYEDSNARAETLRGSIEKMETVARDLFREWEDEIEEIKTPDLKKSSRAKLKDTRTRFEALNSRLKNSSQKMDPILTRLKDHVLYLKHNLNAQSVASLKKEQDRIEGDIEGLIKDMDKAIQQAQEFIKSN